MFYGSFLPHADENTCVIFLCGFSWEYSGLIYVPDAPVSASPYFIVLSIVLGWIIFLNNETSL